MNERTIKYRFLHGWFRNLLLFQSVQQLGHWLATYTVLVAVLAVLSALLELDAMPLPVFFISTAIGASGSLLFSLPVVATGGRREGLLGSVEDFLLNHGYRFEGISGGVRKFCQTGPSFLRWDESDVYIAYTADSLEIRGPYLMVSSMCRRVK